QEDPASVEDTEVVDIHHPAPGALGDLAETTACFHAGVVAQVVHGTEGLDGAVGQGLDVLDAADVGTHTDHAVRPEALLPQFGQCPVQGCLLNIGDGHIGPGLEEGGGQSESDSTGAAGDHGGAVGEGTHDLTCPIRGGCRRRG